MKTEKWQKYADGAVLARVSVREIHPSEERRWNKLIEEKHYLKSARLVGRQMRQVAVLDGQWVALVGWSDAAYHLKWREEWIGWDLAQQKRRRKFVVQNSRYLLLVERGEYPNLASRVLSLCCERLVEDWERRYGYRPLAAESFVDPELFRGSCYRAAGWDVLGPTKGYRRHHRDFYQEDGRPKELWMRLLHPKARKWLTRERLPAPWAGHEDEVPHCRYTREDYRSLWERLHKLTDKRSAKGKQHLLSSALTICALATLCGSRGTRAIADFAGHLTQPQLRLLRCYYDKKTQRYIPPSEPTIRRLLQSVSAAEFDQAVADWSESNDPTPLKRVAVDGKTIKKALQPDGRQLHLVAAVSHESNRLVAQRPVDEKSNEITALEPMLRNVPLDEIIVTADAMQAQQSAARFLSQEKGAQYFFSLKGNQPSIQEKAQNLLSAAFPPSTAASGGNR